MMERITGKMEEMGQCTGTMRRYAVVVCVCVCVCDDVPACSTLAQLLLFLLVDNVHMLMI